MAGCASGSWSMQSIHPPIFVKSPCSVCAVGFSTIAPSLVLSPHFSLTSVSCHAYCLSTVVLPTRFCPFRATHVPLTCISAAFFDPCLSIYSASVAGAAPFQSSASFASTVFVWLVPFHSTKTVSALQVKHCLMRLLTFWTEIDIGSIEKAQKSCVSKEDPPWAVRYSSLLPDL